MCRVLTPVGALGSRPVVCTSLKRQLTDVHDPQPADRGVAMVDELSYGLFWERQSSDC